MKVYIGIDNGTTGSIGIIAPSDNSLHEWWIRMIPTPVILQQNYTKAKKNLNRVNARELMAYFKVNIVDEWQGYQKLALLERPMVNPGRFQATLSGIRCLEAQLCILEALEIPYMYIDSGQWQKELLPQGCHKEQLKKASHDIGIRLFPDLKFAIEKQKDADGILIAEWARRNQL
jgi:hypothetical protein